MARKTRVQMIDAWAMALLAVAVLGAGGCKSRAGREDAAGRGHTPVVEGAGDGGGLAGTCGSTNWVEDDEAVDWDAVEASFDASGPFALVAKPAWSSSEDYCGEVLYARRVAPEEATGRTGPQNGVNRFAYGPMDEKKVEGGAVLVNRLSLLLYPAAIHPAYDLDGRQVGFFVRGLEFADGRTYADAAAVAADPRVRAALDALVGSCAERSSEGASSSDCTDPLAASLAADAAQVGALVRP